MHSVALQVAGVRRHMQRYYKHIPQLFKTVSAGVKHTATNLQFLCWSTNTANQSTQLVREDADSKHMSIQVDSALCHNATTTFHDLTLAMVSIAKNLT